MLNSRTLAFCVSALLASPLAFAQSSSFAHIQGKNCPSGFTESKGMCTSAKGDKEGMVKSGGCPKGFTDTGAYCYREVKASGKTSSAPTSSAADRPWDDSRTYANRPITASVQKTKETDLCPTGYFTNRTNLMRCDTHFDNAPKARLKGSGNCGTGETLERGIYCSGATAMTASQMSSAATADFNELYTALSIKNGSAPNLSSAEPEILAATASQRQAAKAQESADEKAKQDAAAPKQLTSYDPNCTAYLPDVAAANNCQQTVGDMRAKQAALGIAPAAAGAAGTNPVEALKQGLVKGLFGR